MNIPPSVLTAMCLAAGVATAVAFGNIWNQFFFSGSKSKSAKRSDSMSKCFSTEDLLVPGLFNSRNNCFFNVILQSLASCPSMVSYLNYVFEKVNLKKDDDDNENDANENQKHTHPISFSLRLLLLELNKVDKKNRISSPLKIMKLISFSNTSFDFSQQQDPLESLCLLTKKINEEIKNMVVFNKQFKKQPSLFPFSPLSPPPLNDVARGEPVPPGNLHNLSPMPNPNKRAFFEFEFEFEKKKWPLEGSFASWLFCQKCMNKSITIQPFTELALDFKHVSQTNKLNVMGIEDCLSHLIRPELIPSVFCSLCSHKTVLALLKKSMEKEKGKRKQGEEGEGREGEGEGEAEAEKSEQRKEGEGGIGKEEERKREKESEQEEGKDGVGQEKREAKDEMNAEEPRFSELRKVIHVIERCKSFDCCDCMEFAKTVDVQWQKVQSYALKSMIIAKPPEILCLHLHRLTMNAFGKIEKNMTRVLFPARLNLSSSLFCHSSMISNFGKNVSAISNHPQTKTQTKNIANQNSSCQRHLHPPKLQFDPFRAKNGGLDKPKAEDPIENVIGNGNGNCGIEKLSNALNGRDYDGKRSFLPSLNQSMDKDANRLNARAHAYDYDLVAVVVHLGDERQGHYVVYRKVRINITELMDKERKLSDKCDVSTLSSNNSHGMDTVPTTVAPASASAGDDDVDDGRKMNDGHMNFSNDEGDRTGSERSKARDSEFSKRDGEGVDQRNAIANSSLKCFEDVWFFISDGRVKQASVEEVFCANPTLLFYNRIHS